MPFSEAFFRKHAKMARVIPRNASLELDNIEAPSCLLSSTLADQKQNGAARAADSSDTLKIDARRMGFALLGSAHFLSHASGANLRSKRHSDNTVKREKVCTSLL
jgi:hypothetical protein